MSESDFQTKVIKYLSSVGICALRYPATGSGQISGIPDLICLNKECDIARLGWAVVFMELKDIVGTQQKNQIAVSGLLRPYGKTYVPKTPEDIEELVFTLTGIKKIFK